MALFINEQLSIPEDCLSEQSIFASGPGGQHVNKAATGVRLLFDVANSPHLSDGVRRRLLEQARGYINREGMLAVSSTRFRERPRNQLDAREKLAELIRKAMVKPKYRVPTKPGKAAKARRLESKGKRSKVKEMRKKVGRDDH